MTARNCTCDWAIIDGRQHRQLNEKSNACQIPEHRTFVPITHVRAIDVTCPMCGAKEDQLCRIGIGAAEMSFVMPDGATHTARMTSAERIEALYMELVEATNYELGPLSELAVKRFIDKYIPGENRCDFDCSHCRDDDEPESD